MTLGTVASLTVKDPQTLDMAWAHNIPHVMMKERIRMELKRG